ncbi:DAK2 domain-containing protein [Peptostreptococcus faecalis]|uniref:DAK2 domain-containing protein n=1 Tax=Peptostreptococcus faecalis TaxID=2045015 RepID=UPI000C79EE1E|nr:DAK2 domain-containing protein [Peptostreptococcus faecalis]
MKESIDGKLFREMFISGANCLQNNKDLIDKLNVFPVPDGDTGTNMSHTIISAVKELEKVKVDDITEIGKNLSKGSLMGARGNSGVILSQIIRGIAQSVEGKKELKVDEFAKALKSGSATAYKAVMKPIEGTILTVIRETSEFATKSAKKNTQIIIFLEEVLKEANKSLDKTPEKLPALKEAGVVDSGGKGLVCLLEGMLMAAKGTPIELIDESSVVVQSPAPSRNGKAASEKDIKYGYCTEFILESDEVDSDTIRDIVLNYGDSIVVVGYDGVIKVHVHTNNPGSVLQEALKYGQLVTTKIENMRLQHEHTLIDDEEVDYIEQVSSDEEFPVNEEEKENGFITTTMGSGLAEIFDELGVDIVIEGGQTMNPSTEDFVNAINMINAKNIFILPNNGNVIMAANQAKELSDKNVYVVPTKNIPQGISCLVSFDYEADAQKNMENFDEILVNIKSGEVTYAVRDTIMDGIEVVEGDIIGISGKKLISSGKDVSGVTESVIESMVDDDSDIITIYYGEDVEEDSARAFAEKVQDIYADIDVELYYGGQPLYYYLVSVE